MGRRKAERAYVPDSENISKRAMKHSEYAYWGPEPTWKADYAGITQREWDELEKADREKKFHKFANIAHLGWFQLKKGERQDILDWVYEQEIGRAFNWYNAMVDDKHQKEYLIEYAEEHFPNKVAAMKKVDERQFHTYGSLARCFMRGAKLPQKWIDKLQAKIEALAKIPDAVPVVSAITGRAEVVKPTIEERNPDLSKYIGIIDGLLDDFGVYTTKQFPEASMADTLIKEGASNKIRLEVHEHYSKMILELHQALNGVKEVLEYYNGMSRKALQKVYDWLTGKPSTGLVQAIKKTRKPRKKKAKSPESILKRFTYQHSDASLKLQSIDPETILGAQQLWVYNTKKRLLGVYRAKDDTGLGVSRKSITNFNEETSVCKRIRKPEEVVPKIQTIGKVALRHVLDEVRAVENVMRSRISDEVLLLRVV